MINVEFYAVLKDFFGEKRAIGSCDSVDRLIELLQFEKPASIPVLQNVKVAINNKFVSPSTVVADGDVISLLPPSSGG